MRLLPFLSLTSGLLLAVSSASAVTVLSVTGVASQCNSTGGNAGNMATGIVAAKTWRQTQGYANVSISAAIESLNTFPVAFPNFTVYLTTTDGPGTTTAQEIAHASVTAPVVAPWTTNLTTLFTGLTLPPGTYFLTIYGDPNGPALGPSCWTYTNSPVITADAGVSNVQDLQVLGVAAYPPASSFHALSTQQLIQVTGDALAPPTLSKTFGQLTVGALSSATLAFTLKNPNPTLTLDGLQFSDTLPAGLVVSTPNGLTGSCGGGTITAVAGTSTVSLSGATLAGGASCTFSLNVMNNATAVGSVTNTTTTLVSNEAAPGAAASATLFLGDPFLISYAANLNVGESYIDIANTGANGAPFQGPGFGGATGNICANVYTFDPGEELISCCSCLITPDQTVNLGVLRDLTVKTLTGVQPASVTVAVLSTLAGGNGTGTSCTNSAAMVATETLANGIAAWGTTLHATPTAAFATTEKPFSGAILSSGELASIGGRCTSILGNGSGFGVCNSCQAGALGAGANHQ
jgi:hypothetical protein